MMQIAPLLEEALEQAVARHFCKLFDVLMSDPSEQGLERFRAGVSKLGNVHQAVSQIIKGVPNVTTS